MQSVSAQPSKLSVGIFLLVVLLLIVAGFAVLSTLRVDTDTTSGAYSAFFLSNGSVYFGKATESTQPYVILREVYYLRPTGGATNSNTNSADAGLALVRLESELQGPTDQMRINRDHIIFIEELRDDSQVVRAIQAQQ